MDVARIISNKIKMIAENSHQLGRKIIYTLAFSGLIMGLCIIAHILMPLVVHETIDGVIDDKYIEMYCMTKGARALNNLQPPAQ